MFLMGSTTIGISIPTLLRWSGNIPTDEQIAAMCQCLREGDTTVLNRLIDSHIPLALKIASRYAAYAPRYREEIASEAVEALLIGCRNAHEEMIDNNFTGYVTVKIHSKIGNFLKYLRRDHRKTISLSADSILAKPEDILDLRDTIEFAVKDDESRLILDMNLAGYTDIEIANIIGRHRIAVNRAKNDAFELIAAQLRD